MITPKNRIMVVQDFCACRNMIKYILRQMGLSGIDTVGSGDLALRQLRSEEYGIVISDWQMPGLDGLALLKTIRETPELKDIIFIMVTSENAREKIFEAKECGVDGYVMKPFTTEFLCARIVSALRARYPELFQSARKQPAQARAKQAQMKIFGEAATKLSGSCPKNWSITPRSLSSKSFKKQAEPENLSALMKMMSGQFDMFKSDDGFVSVEQILGKVENAMKTAEKQSERAGLIADTTKDIDNVFDRMANAPSGSPEHAEGMEIINRSAAELAEMVGSFDKEVTEVVDMLSGLEHLVRQSQIAEINSGIKKACELEQDPSSELVTPGDGRSAPVSEKVSGELARIQAESENAREVLSAAAGGVARIIDRIKAMDPAERPSLEMFEQLTCQIDGIMDSLEQQISTASTLVSGMEEVANINKEVAVCMGPEEAVCAMAPQQPQIREHAAVRDEDTHEALKKLVKNRMLMINMVKTSHMLCMQKLEELINTKDAVADAEHLPGGPAGSLSKWVNQRTAQKDFHDQVLCGKIAALRDDMYEQSRTALLLLQQGKREEALKVYDAVRSRSDRIIGLLEELLQDLKKKL